MEEKIRESLLQAIHDKVTPSAVVGVIRKDGTQLLVAEGNFTYESDSTKVTENTLYDVASITKSIPTGCIALKLIEEGRLNLNDQLIKYLPEYNNNYREEVLIRHLLTYSIILNFPVPGFNIQTASPDEVRRNLVTVDLKFPPGEKAQYSNSPALILMMVIERITGSTLDVLAHEYFFRPLGMENSTFSPSSPHEIPPTEIEEWRGLVQGVVHDETSFVLSKERPSGCAGLFTNVPDLLIFMRMLVNRGELNGVRYFTEETVREMHTNQLAIPGQVMGLGWELDATFMGTHPHRNTFGKTGFTGVLCAVDPELEVGYVILSNRTYPQRTPADGIQQLRSDIADIIISNV